jgi:alkylated DNA repair protein alkB family protein 1
MSDVDIDQDLEIVDFRRGLSGEQKDRIVPVGTVSSECIRKAVDAFKDGYEDGESGEEESSALPNACTIYEHKDFDGQFFKPR